MVARAGMVSYLPRSARVLGSPAAGATGLTVDQVAALHCYTQEWC